LQLDIYELMLLALPRYLFVAEVKVVDRWAVEIPLWVVVPIVLVLAFGTWKLVKVLILVAKG